MAADTKVDPNIIDKQQMAAVHMNTRFFLIP